MQSINTATENDCTYQVTNWYPNAQEFEFAIKQLGDRHYSIKESKKGVALFVDKNELKLVSKYDRVRLPKPQMQDQAV